LAVVAMLWVPSCHRPCECGWCVVIVVCCVGIAQLVNTNRFVMLT
jgi:hypothetical protein